jgi:hypothetical protein
MITALDESLLHQGAETFAHALTSDHRFFDRTVLGMQSPTGDLALITSMGVYKNNNVMDGFAMIQEASARQYNSRFSRTLRPNLTELALGPLSIEVLEPLKRLRLRLAPGDHPASYDIEWTAALPPHQEPRHFLRHDGRVSSDYLRFDQLATASGWISLEGRRTEFKDWFAWRDHSWGVRPGVGGFDTATGEPNARANFMYLFTWWLTQEEGGLLQVQEDGQGNRLYLDGHIVSRANPGGRALKVVEAEHEISFRPGTRVFDRVRVVAKTDDGQTWEIDGESIGRPWVYKGSGYDFGYNDGRGLGCWRGEWLEEFDVYDVSDHEACILPDGRIIRPMHREQIARVTINGRPGLAHFPLLNAGRIEKYGLGI